MGAKKETEVPAELAKVRGELKKWRGQKRHGQRIPEELWDAATRAARGHGLNRVSRALGLDYYHLKKRAGQGKEKARGAGDGERVFVELANVAAKVAESNAGCVVELEKGNGVKLRVCVADATTVDWCRLKEAFLGA